MRLDFFRVLRISVIVCAVVIATVRGGLRAGPYQDAPPPTQDQPPVQSQPQPARLTPEQLQQLVAPISAVSRRVSLAGSGGLCLSHPDCRSGNAFSSKILICRVRRLGPKWISRIGTRV